MVEICATLLCSSANWFQPLGRFAGSAREKWRCENEVGYDEASGAMKAANIPPEIAGRIETAPAELFV